MTFHIGVFVIGHGWVNEEVDRMDLASLVLAYGVPPVLVLGVYLCMPLCDCVWGYWRGLRDACGHAWVRKAASLGTVDALMLHAVG